MRLQLTLAILLLNCSCITTKQDFGRNSADKASHLESGQYTRVTLLTMKKRDKHSNCPLPIFYVSETLGYPNPFWAVRIRILNKNYESGEVSVSTWNEKFIFSEWMMRSTKEDTAVFRDDILERYRNQKYVTDNNLHEEPKRQDGLLLEFLDFQNLSQVSRVDTVWFNSIQKRRKECYELWIEYY